MTEDTLQSKVFIVTLAAGGGHDYDSHRAGMSVARRVQFATAVATRNALVRQAHYAQRHLGQASRIGSRNGHRLVSGIL